MSPEVRAASHYEHSPLSMPTQSAGLCLNLFFVVFQSVFFFFFSVFLSPTNCFNFVICLPDFLPPPSPLFLVLIMQTSNMPYGLTPTGLHAPTHTHTQSFLTTVIANDEVVRIPVPPLFHQLETLTQINRQARPCDNNLHFSSPACLPPFTSPLRLCPPFSSASLTSALILALLSPSHSHSSSPCLCALDFTSSPLLPPHPHPTICISLPVFSHPLLLDLAASLEYYGPHFLSPLHLLILLFSPLSYHISLSRHPTFSHLSPCWSYISSQSRVI